MRIKLIFIFCLYFVLGYSQTNISDYNTTFGGIHSVRTNPAEIVDSRYKIHISLVGGSFNLANDYLSFNKELLTQDNVDLSDSFKSIYFSENLDGKSKNAFAIFDINGPSFLYTISKKHAIGLTTGLRAYSAVNNISQDLARFFYKNTDNTTWIEANSENLGANSMMYGNIGLTYGREIFNKNRNYLKAGLTLKANFGLAAVGFNTKNLTTNVLDNDYLGSANGEVGTYYSNKLSEFSDIDFLNSSNLSLGFDFGVIYEKRRDESFTYEMDCKEDNERNDINKYKYRIGASVSDFGGIKFKNDIKFSSTVLDSNAFKNIPFESFEELYQYQDAYDTLAAYGAVNSSTVREFSYNLPTKINFFVDYNIFKNFYLAANINYYMNRSSDELINFKIDNTSINLTPKFDTKLLGLYLPIQYHNFTKEINVGFGARVFCFNVGIQDWTVLAFKKESKNAGVYFSTNIPIMNKKKPKDRDLDLISDKIDNCKDIAGDCENMGCPPPDDDEDGIPNKEDKCPSQKGTMQTSGCPDDDKDGIANKEDNCPKLAGVQEFNGCPDTDNDKIPDNEDKCPKEFGSKDVEGCPDSDNDKVANNDDKCPDVPGLIANEGCPKVEEKDTDLDGINDKDDKCPFEYGPKSSFGCPQSEVSKIQKLVQEKLEFNTGTAILKESGKTILNMVSGLMKKYQDYKLKISGHTDNVGNEEKNMKLSILRSNSVMNYLIKRGVKSSRIEAKGYGQTMPIGDNDSEAGRKVNRRVEIDFVK